jgi:hypothetical protein
MNKQHQPSKQAVRLSSEQISLCEIVARIIKRRLEQPSEAAA